MNRESERMRLVELIDDFFKKESGIGFTEEFLGELADKILAEGWMRPPVKVGQTVYYVSDSPINLSVQANTIYEAHIARLVTTQYGTTLVIQIHNSYGCTEIPDINDWGKTVFLTREEAEKMLKGSKNNG